MTEKTGLYIHIPFCVRKCNYCAFLSFDAETSPRREYADAVVNEITRRAEELGHPEIDTVYVGGGTPSVLDLSQMRDIMHAVNKHFRVKEDAEVTIEANPATLGRKDGVMLAKLQAYKYMGFNRLSMGVQSMNNDRLRYLGRIHTAENVARDMELIRRKGFDNVNLDLMFSIPGESTADALDDLRRILALSPEHISCYSLQIEEGTPFGEMAASGELTEIPDEDDRRTYHEICRMLDEAGYEHYEISNFAKKTDDAGGPSLYRSRHNSLYWDMSDYIGIGLGASGFTGGRRYKNTSDIAEYIEFFRELPVPGIDSSEIPLEEEHVNSSFDNISEAVFTGLRRREG
ncbi:MAG: radical SAM family heme chaperone HemW, partial [Clostridiales bacterium]|nr:radical SAM family heme chaperone HemW [Clostridiales bacterium]